MRQFLNFVKWLSAKIRTLMGKAEGKIANQETKKISSPKALKKFFTFAGISFVSTILIVTMMSKTDFVGRGLEDFKKQKGVKFGVSRPDTSKKIDVIDPLERFEGTETKEQQCQTLHEKVSSNEKLNRDEFILYKQCLAQEMIPGLTTQQKKALTALADPDSQLSEGARELLARAAAGEVTDPEELRLVNALTSSDPLARQVANKMLDPNTSEAEKKLLGDFLAGKVSREVAQGIVDGNGTKAIALNQAIKEGKNEEANKIREELKPKEAPMSSMPDNGALTNEQEAIKVALEDQENVLKEEKKRLDGYSQVVPKLEDKLSEGKPLTAGEQAILKDYKRTKDTVDLLEKQKSQTYADYQRIMSKINVKVGKSYSEFTQENPEIIDEYDPRAHIKPEPIVVKKEVVKKTPRITPSEYELIKAIKRARMSEDFEGSLYANVDPATFQQKEIVASAGSLGRMNPLKNYNLPLDLKIPAVVESSIFVSSNDSANRRVIAKILDNVYNPENNDILLPKGSKVVCTTGSFDVNTKLMQVSCSKVRVGKETLDVGFSIVDSTGKAGIPGGVLRTRYKHITAAVLTDFAAGVTEFFSRYAQQQMLQNGINNLSLTNSVTGGAFQGLSAGLTKIAETLTQDLQNSPDIFFSPEGIKLILIPN